MSWSVNATGKGDGLKAALTTQFDSAEASTANIPEELEIVKKCRDLALSSVDLCPNGLSVEAWGSVYVTTAQEPINVRAVTQATFKIEVKAVIIAV